jgi:hypothetical protein
MENPIKAVFDVTMQLRANKPVFRREHVVIIRVARTCRIEKSNVAFFSHIFDI